MTSPIRPTGSSNQLHSRLANAISVNRASKGAMVVMGIATGILCYYDMSSDSIIEGAFVIGLCSGFYKLIAKMEADNAQAFNNLRQA